ncbi:MAG: threonine/serine dehydratase [Anaerolineales bacterium]|nr:threonine/serine dehydratase [Anaerolineales bacterium]
MLTLLDFLTAQSRIKPYLHPTLLEPSVTLGAGVYFKLENTNLTHAFKIRGALNAILAQADIARERGIIAASAGNHAVGVAYAAQLADATATLVMPRQTPQRKVEGARRLGATIVLYGDIYDEAEIHARELEQREGTLFVSPYNDPYVIAGQGTISLELLETIPSISRILVPTSGGGLLAGVATAAKLINPAIEVIGVQSVATPAMYNAFYGTDHSQLDTIADGLAGKIEEGSITVPLCRQYTDRIVLVEEQAIHESIRWVFRQHGWAIEGAAAVGVAALLTGQIEPQAGTVVIISGGNIDVEKFLHVMAE